MSELHDSVGAAILKRPLRSKPILIRNIVQEKLRRSTNLLKALHREFSEKPEEKVRTLVFLHMRFKQCVAEATDFTHVGHEFAPERWKKSR